MTLSGGRQLEFQAVSDLVAELSFATKSFTTQHQKQREIDNQMLAKKINDGRIFTPKIDNPLDDVIDIIDDPNAEHKKTTFPYVEPTVQLPDEIEDTHIQLMITGGKMTYSATLDATKMIVDDIKEPTNNILNDIDIKALSDVLRNLRPRDNRTIQELIDDDFIPIDDRTPQERMDDDNISLQSDDKVTIEDVLEPDEVETRPPLYNVIPPKQNIVTIEDIFKPPMAGTIPPTAPAKTLDVDINALSDNILRNLWPVEIRNLQNLIDDDFIPIDDNPTRKRR